MIKCTVNLNVNVSISWIISPSVLQTPCILFGGGKKNVVLSSIEKSKREMLSILRNSKYEFDLASHYSIRGHRGKKWINGSRDSVLRRLSIQHFFVLDFGYCLVYSYFIYILSCSFL